MFGRLVHSADFERVLATIPKVRSAHFAVHHVADVPAGAREQRRMVSTSKLSTSTVQNGDRFVDKSVGHRWLGLVVPKRMARRAVTRQLLRRQMRAAMQRHAAMLPAGMWVLRLRAGFDTRQYVSAASAALRRAARGELDALLDAAAAADARP